MLFLHPGEVTFGSDTWSGVESVSIERSAERSFVEFSDDGPHVVLADVPEQRVVITVVQELAGDDMDAPRPGEEEVLVFETSPNSSGAGRKQVRVTSVVLGVKYRVSGKSGSVRTVELVAVSSDGMDDPVSMVDL